MTYVFLFVVALVCAIVVPRILKSSGKSSFASIASLVSWIVVAGTVLGIIKTGFNYAEPGYVYHVRDVFGREAVVANRAGWFFAGWREPIRWPREFTVSFDKDTVHDKIAGRASATLPPYSITMADNVRGEVSAIARFRLPADEVQFLTIAHRYRSPQRLISAALLPSTKQALDATASLMSAEEYFTSGRNQFKQKYRETLSKGVPLTRRVEKRVPVAGSDAGAQATEAGEKAKLGDDTKIVMVNEEITDGKGSVIRDEHQYQTMGIVLADAILTHFDADDSFEERIKNRRKAAAERAVAREQRLKQEEERLLEVARGQKEIAIEQAKVQKAQIQKTTDAETQRKLAIIEANRRLEEARISKETSEVALEKAKIDAQSIKELADANAYEKRVLIEADGALQPKLDAYQNVMRTWADAFSKRQVPQYVFGGGAGASGNGAVPAGNNADTIQFQQMLNALVANRLVLDTAIKGKPE